MALRAGRRARRGTRRGTEAVLRACVADSAHGVRGRERTPWVANIQRRFGRLIARHV